jgi:hypothetical protein
VIAQDEKNSIAVVDDELPAVYTQLALDRSASMNAGKLETLRRAATFLVDSIPDGESVGVVVFDHDADTKLRRAVMADDTRETLRELVDGFVNSSGCTSIGDALFEAQSNIYLEHKDDDDDETIELPADTQHRVILLTDGQNTAGYEPFEYYNPNPEPFGSHADSDELIDCGIPDPKRYSDLVCAWRRRTDLRRRETERIPASGVCRGTWARGRLFRAQCHRRSYGRHLAHDAGNR